MANIDFYGYVDDVRGSWLLRVAEPHSKMISGNWQTVSRTWRDVKPAYGTDLDFTSFMKGDRVHVTGIERTEMREYEGKKIYDLQVRALNVVAAPLPKFENAKSPTATPEESDWVTAPLGDEPF